MRTIDREHLAARRQAVRDADDARRARDEAALLRVCAQLLGAAGWRDVSVARQRAGFTVRARHASDPAAPVATFTLGWAAGSALVHALRVRPPGDHARSQGGASPPGDGGGIGSNGP